MNTVAFHTLGCKVNQYDTQAMLELFRAAGYAVVPFHEAADVYVVNTCTVTGTGDKKSMQITRRLRREHPESEIILCGCLAQRKGEALLETGARLILGTQRRSEVVTLLEEAVRQGKQICAVDALTTATPFENLTITDQEEHTRATLKIQEGCNNHCTYCIIPSVRGPIRSRPLADIAAESLRLAQAGFRELVLTGIHLSSYGKDLDDGATLLDAIQAVQDTPGILRIRLGSLEPTIATADFAACLARMDKVCPQFHLALQSGSDTVLARMARRYNTRMYLDAVDNLRAAFPHAAFTTDVLTGFPGETEEEYQDTRRMIETVGYAKIHVFPYSQREGTKAAVMPNQLPNALKDQRARELIALGETTARAYQESWLGLTAPVLLEEQDADGNWLGYTPEYIQVTVPDCPACRSGAVLSVRLAEASAEGLLGCIEAESINERKLFSMNDCLFCKIIAGGIPSTKVYEDEKVYAFRDINPQAPTHVLVIPKQHVSGMSAVNEADDATLAACLRACQKVAELEGLGEGFRVVSNCGAHACQSVQHLHFHVLGGRQMGETMA